MELIAPTALIEPDSSFILTLHLLQSSNFMQVFAQVPRRRRASPCAPPLYVEFSS
jgi:hypothetical protein